MHQPEVDGTRKYSKCSVCSEEGKGVMLSSYSKVEEVMHSYMYPHTIQAWMCIMILWVCRWKQLLQTAVAPRRRTAANGISATSMQLWSCLRLSRRNPPSLMSTDGHQTEDSLARTTRDNHWLCHHGSSLCLTDWDQHWVCVCVQAQEWNMCFTTTLIIIPCSHSDNTWACWPTQAVPLLLLLLLPLPALPFDWSFSS